MTASHSALQPGNLAVITGGASGIGIAVARRLAALGLRLCLVDRDEAALAEARATLSEAHCVAIDVSDRAALEALAADVGRRLGPVSVLMNNAGFGLGVTPLTNPEGWVQIMGTNLFGAVHGIQAFVPAMVERGEPGLVICTGSKQGITNPPGDAAYAVSKAGIKVLAEQLAHTLRNTPGCQVTAHLLIPGFTYTGSVRRHVPQKPAFAWEPDQVAERLLAGLEAGEFYILCEDNETTREMDEKRILWAALDLVENRPPLSRWHPDYKDAFAAYMARPRLA